MNVQNERFLLQYLVSINPILDRKGSSWKLQYVCIIHWALLSQRIKGNLISHDMIPLNTMSKVTLKGYLSCIQNEWCSIYFLKSTHRSVFQAVQKCKFFLDFFLYCLLILHEHKSKLPPKEHSVNHFTGNKVCWWWITFIRHLLSGSLKPF